MILLFLRLRSWGRKHRIKRWTFAIISFVLIALLFSFIWFRKFDGRKNSTENVENSKVKSLAIIPFKSLNKDQENEYFSDGVADAIARHLLSISDLRLISRTSTERYRGSPKSAKEIAGELDVSNLLEGSVQRYENTVRIEVRLIDAKTESQIWAKNYDHELKDIFQTQSDVAEQVASELKTTLSSNKRPDRNQGMTNNAEAYDLYLKGKYEYRTNYKTGNRKSIELFKRAITLDSNFAMAYVVLARSYIASASVIKPERSALEALAASKPLIDKALTIDPELPEAHAFNGYYLLYNNWDFEGAEEEYKKGIENNDPDALSVYADFLNFVGRHDEALTISKRLRKNHPLYPHNLVILSLYYTGKYDEAINFAESQLKLFNNYFTLDNYGFLMLNTGNYKKAIQLFQRAINEQGIRFPRMLGWMGAAYANLGDEAKALELINELKTKRELTNAGSPAFFIAVIYAALEDKKSALNWLKEAYNHHEMEMPWLKTEPQLYPLHYEPEFLELVDKVGFP